MTADELYAELEQDLAWRSEEVRFLQNTVSGLSEPDLEKFCRVLVLVVYAHLEGFVKFALLAYVRVINDKGLPCVDAAHAATAAALHDVLLALRNPLGNPGPFRESAQDPKLAAFARDIEFLQRVEEFMTRPVRISDSAVNTESNLWPIVLRKNLYRLGLQHEMFSHLDGALSRLVNTRNEIGHGSRKDGVKWREYQELQSAAIEIMQDLRACVFTATSLEWFRR